MPSDTPKRYKDREKYLKMLSSLKEEDSIVFLSTMRDVERYLTNFALGASSGRRIVNLAYDPFTIRLCLVENTDELVDLLIKMQNDLEELQGRVFALEKHWRA